MSLPSSTIITEPRTGGIYWELKLKACRCDIGITQQRMAQDLALDIQSVNRYENGKRDPSLATALRITAYFNKTVEEIFALQDQK